MSRIWNVLVLEDDPLVSLDIEGIVADMLPAEIVTSASIAEAELALMDPIDLALLDIDVIGGKSYAIAERLAILNTPVIFVSASRPEELPPSLRDLPFVSKPYATAKVEEAIRDSLGIHV